MKTDQIFLCHAPADSNAANQLALVLTNKGLSIYREQPTVGEAYDEAWESAMQGSSHVLLLLSTSSVRDKFFLLQVQYAREHNIKVIPVMLEQCEVPLMLRHLFAFPLESMYTVGLNLLVDELKGSYINLSSPAGVAYNDYVTINPRQSELPIGMPAPTPQSNPSGKGFFKTILETLNPFSAKAKTKQDDGQKVEQRSDNHGGYQRIDTRPNTYANNPGFANDDLVFSDFFKKEESNQVAENDDQFQPGDDLETYSGPILMSGPPEGFAGAEPPSSPPAALDTSNVADSQANESSPKSADEKTINPKFYNQEKGFGFIVNDQSNLGEFIHVSGKIDKPQPLPKGKLLYDIPDAMTVNVPQRCLVRIGASEAIVIDDDSFSPAVKIEAVPISKVMEVDMADISEPANFNVKKISSNEQMVEDDSYTEWIFMVTPLTSGKHPLILKVSVIRLVDGKERRKELVFEKSVNISAAQQQPTPSIMTFTSQPGVIASTKAEAPLKDLGAETMIEELDPPSVFISYAHLDKIYFDIFIQYLKTHSNWNFWTDRNIEIGSDWYQSIEQSITDSDVAVLLISANFLSSQFIKEHEFSKFITLKNKKQRFHFLPIFLRDVDFTRWEELAAMQMFVAYGDEYGVPEKRGQMISFSKLCRFDINGQLIPNDNLDTFFKNLVKKAEQDWMKQHFRTLKIT